MEMIKGQVHWERGDFSLLIAELSKEDSATRHEIRYALFRAQTELDGGNTAEPEHWVIVRKILKLEGAGHVLDFAGTWDVAYVTPEPVIVQRMWSIHQEHNQMMRRVTVSIEKNDTPETLARKEHVVIQREKRRVKSELKKARKQNSGSQSNV